MSSNEQIYRQLKGQWDAETNYLSSIGKNFSCLACGYKQDADLAGAMNIRTNALRFLDSLESSRS